ncbi:MAG TPA: hypothetical protein PK402_11840 [Tepidisphaeraceae bacterium]|nr:hypothetical protein [Tepidisphaeraceae bacterium]
MSTTDYPPIRKKFWNERRANLVFIVFIVLLTVPGGTILTLKKLRGAGGNTFPPAVRHQLAYMDSTAGRSNVQLRVVPRQLGGWVEALAAKRLNMTPDIKSLVPTSGWEPAMSDDRHLQFIGVKNESGAQRFMIFVWNQSCSPTSESFTISQLAGQTESSLEIEAMSAELLPAEIRSELQNYGYIDPPTRVIWMVLRGTAPAPATQINFKFTSDRVDVVDQLNVPTS